MSNRKGKYDFPRGIHVNNKNAYLAWREVKTPEGKPTIVSKTLMILDRLATFGDKCWLKNNSLMDECGLGIGEKAFRRHERFLEEIKCIEIERIFDPQANITLKYRRILMPTSNIVMSEREFNRKMKQNKQENNDFGLPQNSPPGGSIMNHEGGSTLSERVVDLELSNKLTINHPKPSFAANFTQQQLACPTASDMKVGQTAGRPGHEASPRPEGLNFSLINTEKNNVTDTGEEIDEFLGIPKKELSEPMYPQRKFKTKRPKNEIQRKLSNVEKNLKGHCAPPIAGASNSSHIMRNKAMLAPTTGSVSPARLYYHLCYVCDQAYGEGIAEPYLPRDRSGFEAWVAELRQRFIDLKGFDPTRREVADYFTWFFTPENVKVRSKNDKIATAPVLAHLNMLRGHGSIVAFCDKVLRAKKPSLAIASDPKLAAQMGVNDFLSEAFEAFRKHREDEMMTLLDLLKFGFVLYAQYLHDEIECTESECKQRIIGMMVRYFRSHTRDESNLRFQKIMKITETNKALYDDSVSVFKEWQSLCPSMIATAIEQAGEKE